MLAFQTARANTEPCTTCECALGTASWGTNPTHLNRFRPIARLVHRAKYRAVWGRCIHIRPRRELGSGVKGRRFNSFSNGVDRPLARVHDHASTTASRPHPEAPSAHLSERARHAPYAPRTPRPTNPSIEAVFTIEPPPRSNITGTACLHPRNWPLRLTATRRSNTAMSSVAMSVSIARAPVNATATVSIARARAPVTVSIASANITPTEGQAEPPVPGLRDPWSPQR